MKFRSDGNLGIFVADIKKAKAFYSNVLGFRLMEESDEKLSFDTGTCKLYINKESAKSPIVPALEVEDYEEAKGYLLKNGCELVRDWPEYKALWFRDPMGQVFDIIEK